MRHRIIIILIPVIFLIFFFNPSEGETEEATNKRAPVSISSDTLEYIKETDTYIAKGSVEIIQEDTHILADYATLDNTTGDVHAEGNVVYYDKDNVLFGDKADVNLNTDMGVVYNSRIFNIPDNYYISGKEMKKVGESEYTADKATFTTCDAPIPAWKFTGSNVKVSLNDYITANNVLMYVKNIPILYTPYLKLPVKKERQSGFLMPRFGHSNKKGAFLNNAYYWAMADNMDSTYYLDYWSKLGKGGGAEYRYIFGNDASGYNNISGYAFYYHAHLHTTERHKNFGDLVIKHSHPLPDSWYGNADIRYLPRKELYRTYDILYRDYRQFLQERYKSSLESNIHASKSTSDTRTYALMRVTQDLYGDTKRVIQKLPEVGYVLSDKEIFGYSDKEPPIVPLRASLNTTGVYFYRKDGLTAQRIDINPAFNSPFNLGRGFVLTPRLGLRETFYNIGDNWVTRNPHRELFDTGASLTTRVSRVFDVKGPSGMDRMKHVIEPDIGYSLVPRVNQRDIPSFDGVDSIGRSSVISYGVTNRFIARYEEEPDKEKSPEDKGSKGKERVVKKIEFLTLRLSQSYDIHESRRRENLITSPSRPYSPITAELGIKTPTLFSLTANSSYNTYTRVTPSHNLEAKLEEKEWFVKLIERYTKSPRLLYFIGEAGVKPTKYIDFNIMAGYDGAVEKLKEFQVSQTVRLQCWAINIMLKDSFREKETPYRMHYWREREIFVTFELKGVGKYRVL
ncbi:MAG: LPS assembly protein LptD [Nitrospirota bacterium]